MAPHRVRELKKMPLGRGLVQTFSIDRVDL